jgi:hypothetical protein
MKKPKVGEKVWVVLPDPNRDDGEPARLPLLPGVVEASSQLVTSEEPVQVKWNGFCRRRFERGDFLVVEGPSEDDLLDEEDPTLDRALMQPTDESLEAMPPRTRAGTNDETKRGRAGR